jgi:hypothetical protein
MACFQFYAERSFVVLRPVLTSRRRRPRHEAVQLDQKNTHRCRRFEAFCVFRSRQPLHPSQRQVPACFPLRKSYTHVMEFPKRKGSKIEQAPSQLPCFFRSRERNSAAKTVRCSIGMRGSVSSHFWFTLGSKELACSVEIRWLNVG